jgi:hypothetical protein
MAWDDRADCAPEPGVISERRLGVAAEEAAVERPLPIGWLALDRNILASGQSSTNHATYVDDVTVVLRKIEK